METPMPIGRKSLRPYRHLNLSKFSACANNVVDEEG